MQTTALTPRAHRPGNRRLGEPAHHPPVRLGPSGAWRSAENLPFHSFTPQKVEFPSQVPDLTRSSTHHHSSWRAWEADSTNTLSFDESLCKISADQAFQFRSSGLVGPRKSCHCISPSVSGHKSTQPVEITHFSTQTPISDHPLTRFHPWNPCDSWLPPSAHRQTRDYRGPNRSDRFLNFTKEQRPPCTPRHKPTHRPHPNSRRSSSDPSSTCFQVEIGEIPLFFGVQDHIFPARSYRTLKLGCPDRPGRSNGEFIHGRSAHQKF
jgi:hypothetical protein